MPRRLRTDLPGPDWRVSLEQLRDPGPDGIFPARLPRPVPLVVDVGFGRGELLLWLACAEPGRAYLGIEYSGKRVLKMARRLARTEHDNVRLHTSLEPGLACGIATVEIVGIDAVELAQQLWRQHRIIVVGIRHPEFQGIRVSPSVYTTIEEIDRFADALEAIAERGSLPA